MKALLSPGLAPFLRNQAWSNAIQFVTTQQTQGHINKHPVGLPSKTQGREVSPHCVQLRAGCGKAAFDIGEVFTKNRLEAAAQVMVQYG